MKFVYSNYMYRHTENQEWMWDNFLCECMMTIFKTSLPWFYPCFWPFHDFCTTTIHTQLKLNIVPVHLWSYLSIGFEIKLIARFLRLLRACQHPFRPTPLLTETCSYCTFAPKSFKKVSRQCLFICRDNVTNTTHRLIIKNSICLLNWIFISIICFVYSIFLSVKYCLNFDKWDTLGIIFRFIQPVRSVGFRRCKKIPYQAPPIQLRPQKCTFWKNPF